MASPTAIAAYLALFAAVGFLFVFVNLLLGWLVRPSVPGGEKGNIYECGEPAIGSSFVQFDLRFYVVALLFIIFDVEVAFFFPWGTVFGKTTELMSENVPVLASDVSAEGSPNELSPVAAARLRELGDPEPAIPELDEASADGPPRSLATRNRTAVRRTAARIAWTSFADIGVFFAVLLVGFAYVWKRGDLDWVRAVRSDQEEGA